MPASTAPLNFPLSSPSKKGVRVLERLRITIDRKSTRLNSSHLGISYAVFCLKKKKKKNTNSRGINRNIHNISNHDRHTSRGNNYRVNSDSNTSKRTSRKTECLRKTFNLRSET